MELGDLQLREKILEEIYSLIDGMVEVCSDLVIVRLKDAYPQLNRRLIRKYPYYGTRISKREIYNMFKSIDALEENPDKKWHFTTYKRKWKEFREKQT